MKDTILELFLILIPIILSILLIIIKYQMIIQMEICLANETMLYGNIECYCYQPNVSCMWENDIRSSSCR